MDGIRSAILSLNRKGNKADGHDPSKIPQSPNIDRTIVSPLLQLQLYFYRIDSIVVSKDGNGLG